MCSFPRNLCCCFSKYIEIKRGCFTFNLQFIYVLVLDTEEGIVVQQAGYEDTEVM